LGAFWWQFGWLFGWLRARLRDFLPGSVCILNLLKRGTGPCAFPVLVLFLNPIDIVIILILPLLPDIVEGALAEGQEEGDEHEEEAHAEYGLIELRNMIELVCRG
jgi:hypothetical protein